MRKFGFIFVIVLALSFCACCTSDSTSPADANLSSATSSQSDSFAKIVYSDFEPQNDVIPKDDSTTPEMKITQIGYESSGGIKSIRGNAVEYASNVLESLSETGKRIKVIYSPDYEDLDAGTYWIKFEKSLYYIPSDYSEVYRIVGTKHEFGDKVTAKLLKADKEVINKITRIYAYWPYDYWRADYKDGVLDVSHNYKAETTITATVKEMNITKQQVTVELVSSITQEKTVKICSEDGCIVYEEQEKTVKLKANEPQVVTFDIYCSNADFYADKTKIVFVFHGYDDGKFS